MDLNDFDGNPNFAEANDLINPDNKTGRTRFDNYTASKKLITLADDKKKQEQHKAFWENIDPETNMRETDRQFARYDL